MTDPQSAELGPHEDTGLDILKLSVAPHRFHEAGDFETLFTLARSTLLLERLAAELEQPILSSPCISPVEVLGLALDNSISRDRPVEMAEFTLARAHWLAAKTSTNPLNALRSGNDNATRRAFQLADACEPQVAAVWYLLLAWELYEGGNPGAARECLHGLIKKDPSELAVPLSRHAVEVLRYVGSIDETSFLQLQAALLDENDRMDLCKRLTEDGELPLAALIADSIGWPDSRARELGRVARAQALAGLHADARSNSSRALHALALTDEGDPKAVEYLAGIAATVALSGDNQQAHALFAKAIAAAGRHVKQAPETLAKIAAAQAKAGMVDAAEQTIAMLPHWPPDGRLEALDAIAIRRAEAGDFDGALLVLNSLQDSSYVDLKRVVREVARRLVGSGQTATALQLADRVPSAVREPTLAAIAVALARRSEAEDALKVAQRIADRTMRARCMVDIAVTGEGRHTSTEPALKAVGKVKDTGLRAELLAELTATMGQPVRDDIFTTAIKLAAKVNKDDRWSVLANIAIEQHQAGSPAATATFKAAADIVLRGKDTDRDEKIDELWRLGIAQAQCGDTAGARDTFAAALYSQQDPQHWLKPVTLASIATVQARHGDRKSARRTMSSARKALKRSRTDEPSAYTMLVATALIDIGDAAGAFRLVVKAADEADDWTDAVPIAYKLAESGDEEGARMLLAHLVNVARRSVGPSGFHQPGSLAELARAQVRIGEVDAALLTAGLDITGDAAEQTYVAIADAQARADDVETARNTIEKVRWPRYRAAAFRAIGTTLASRGRLGLAHAMFDSAIEEAKRNAPPEMSVTALTDISYAATVAAAPEIKSRSLADARQISRDIPDLDDRARSLAQVAKAQAALGDIADAQHTAEEITIPEFKSEALYWAALAAAAEAKPKDPHDLVSAMRLIESPRWRAAGLVATAALAERIPGLDVRPYWAEADRVLNMIPAGNPRTQICEFACKTCLEIGRHDGAIRLARKMTTHLDLRLVTIANMFMLYGAELAFKHLLPECTQHLTAAHTACHVLAQAHPRHAHAIAEEVGKSRSLSPLS